MEIFFDISKREDSDIYPVVSDSYSYLLSKISNYNSRLLFIANDDTDLNIIAKQLQFFKPKSQVITLSNWDCMPYDKVSPNIINLTQRIGALYKLSTLKEDATDIILLVNLSSLIQRLPPKSLLPGLSKKITVGEIVKRGEFLSLLQQLSFRRVEVATEPGDFAVRGDIIDIVVKSNVGWRLDFFGNKVEKIRTFDPISQISNGTEQKIHILPSSEVILNKDTINNFCLKFKDNFGIGSTDHPLYEAIEWGRKYSGMEHYLSCFYEELSDIFDYFLPTQVICENDFSSQLDNLYSSIRSHYKRRQDLLADGFQDEVIYYPLEPNKLWMTKAEIDVDLKKYKTANLYEYTIDSVNGIELDMKRTDNFEALSKLKNISAFDLFKKYRDSTKHKVIIACNSEGSSQRIKGILENYNIHWYLVNGFENYKKVSGKTVGVCVLPMEHGYTYDDFSFVAENDLLGKKIIRKKSNKTLELLMSEINNLQIGEYVVHQKHGIGLFSGLETISAAGVMHDCIKIIYDDDDVLYIPVENLDLLTRYGGSESNVSLDRLGSNVWSNRKSKLKEKLKEIAAHLIKTAALRASREGEYLKSIPEVYEEFCLGFPYMETEDQQNSIDAVLEDLASGKQMDRLVCGDVGFGKTEVAMRAAFVVTHPDKNVKKQVAIIAPTTLLARQHYHSFLKRFAGFSVQIRQLSRLVSAKEVKLTKAGLKDGSIDIVIGTHSLLADDIEFKDLGLLVVDEEQRFGVLQKEKIKKIQKQLHVLTLSATPIPRTLQMSLTGVRDLSIIATPPIDRQVVKTYIMNYDSVVIREAILREFYRGGQIFFVCPRISDINEILPKLVELVPEIKIVVAHGKMSPASLEKIMTDFYNKKFNLLLSTSIIESGIDISEANTIIIHRADKFGLSALYQLRGRVGRSNVKAFSYLLLPNKKLSKLSATRLEVMQTLDTLGAGFTVASHDMDIRGFGNLVGDEQSGHIKEVGLELYQQMLQDAILSLKNPSKEDLDIEDEDYSPQINLGLPVLLPEEYIEDLNLRLSLYRSLAGFKALDEVENFAIEIIDRFGDYPKEVEYLLSVIKLKIKAKKINIEKIDAGPKAITFAFKDNKCLHPDELLDFITKNMIFIKLRSDQKLLINKEFTDIKLKIKFIDELLDKLDF